MIVALQFELKVTWSMVQHLNYGPHPPKTLEPNSPSGFDVNLAFNSTNYPSTVTQDTKLFITCASELAIIFTKLFSLFLQ